MAFSFKESFFFLGQFFQIFYIGDHVICNKTNKPKQMKNVRALQLSAYNPTITSPHTSSSLKYFQREVGTVQDSARPEVCNLTHVWRSTPAFFQAIDQEELLASQ